MKTEFNEYLETIKHRKTKYGDVYRIVYVPRRFVENTVLCSGDGLENRIAAKDMLYKFNAWLKKNKGRSIEIDPMKCEWCDRNRTSLTDSIDHPRLKPHIRSWFREWLEFVNEQV